MKRTLLISLLTCMSASLIGADQQAPYPWTIFLKPLVDFPYYYPKTALILSTTAVATYFGNRWLKNWKNEQNRLAYQNTIDINTINQQIDRNQLLIEIITSSAGNRMPLSDQFKERYKKAQEFENKRKCWQIWFLKPSIYKQTDKILKVPYEKIFNEINTTKQRLETLEQ